MNLNEAMTYINAATWSQWKLGLGRTRELLDRLGNPQRELRFVHIAGTNGKGSTTAMIESVLRAAGYRTGMFPSPYIEDFRERIQVDAQPIAEDALCELTERVRDAADAMEDHPSQFELITAIGMLYFQKMQCDVVVLEVGLGGEFDSTNVIDAPDVAVITNIGFDHTDYLGDTLAKIASAKAGIIKSGSAVVAYPNVPEVMEVIAGACDRAGCPLAVADFGRMTVRGADLTGQQLSWRAEAVDGAEAVAVVGTADEAAAETDSLTFTLPLVGEYQIRNAAVALTAVEAFRRRGWSVPDEAIVRGMETVCWPARFEVLGTDPLFILDGGHNLQCAEAVALSLEKYLPTTKVTLLIGMLADKDYLAVIDTLLPYAARCYCVTPDSPRALAAKDLAARIRERMASDWDSSEKAACDVRETPACYVRVFASIPEAVQACLDEPHPVLAFGSLYMAGEVRKAYRKLTAGGTL
ncbi:MAG: bifunctional folylpolyglutamate synthase/dihydrofolate synthase [Mogibacterium sp.]|nr:bifunctional folylpolyglutamate synthase/dihydrofolate synthase [Mogibacterium sp.]